MKMRLVLLTLVLSLWGSTTEVWANEQIYPPIDQYCEDVLGEIAGSSSQETSISVEDSFYLYNFVDEPIAIFYKLQPFGFAIYDFVGTTVLEYSKEYDHLYYLNSEITYYYEGVLQYYIRENDSFKNLITGQRKVIEEGYCFCSENFYHSSDNNTERSYAPETYLENETRFYDCNISENMSYFFPDLTEEEQKNCPGVCGSLACAVLIAYYDDYCSDLAGNGDFVSETYKTYGMGTKGYYGKFLVGALVKYIEPNGNGSVFLDPGMTSYLQTCGIRGGLSMGILTVYQQTKNAIDSGVPLIVGLVGHYAVGIGYCDILEKQIYLNYGDGRAMWVNANTVLNTWKMNLY